jgi:outer membrane protein TolC
LTAENEYKETLKLYENTSNRYANLIANTLDINRIKLTVLEKEENLIQAKESMEKNMRKIKDFMRSKSNDFIKPEKSDVEIDINSDFDSTFENKMAKSRTFQILAELEKQGITAAEIKKRALMPSAKLFAVFKREGTGYFPSEGTTQNLSLGISINKLFPAKKEKDEYNSALIDSRQTILSNEINKDNIKLELLELYNEINKIEKILTLYNNKLKSANIILQEEEKNFAIGKTQLKDYIDAINSRDSIIHSIENLKSEYNSYKIEWLRLTDNLVKENLEELVKE